MKVRVVKHYPSEKYRVQYKFLWWWSYMTRFVPKHDMDAEGNLIDQSHSETLVFDSCEDAVKHLINPPQTKDTITVVKELEI